MLATARRVYEQVFGQPPDVTAIHAGLECGIIGQRVGDVDMVSFGPTIEGAHSPDERLNIPTTAKFWNLVVKTLENVAKSA